MASTSAPPRPTEAIPSARPAGARGAALRLLGDDLLARRAGRGDSQAFKTIYERYHQPLYRYCRSIVRDPDDAADALQNTMVNAFRAMGTRRPGPLKAWLFRIAHNESVSLLRRRPAHQDIDEVAERETLEVGVDPAARERLRQLMTDLGELPVRQRGALVMRELSGLDYQEIGDVFGVSAAAAKQTVYEARTALHDQEIGRGMACDEVCRVLSVGDRRALRGRKMAAHLRDCANCLDFQAALGDRPRALAAITPALPVAAAAGILEGVLAAGPSAGLAAAGAAGAGGVTAGAGSVGGVGAGAGSAGGASAGAGSAGSMGGGWAGGSGLFGGLGGGAAQAIAGSAVAKSVAAVAAAATVAGASYAAVEGAPWSPDQSRNAASDQRSRAAPPSERRDPAARSTASERARERSSRRRSERRRAAERRRRGASQGSASAGQGGGAGSGGNSGGAGNSAGGSSGAAGNSAGGYSGGGTGGGPAGEVTGRLPGGGSTPGTPDRGTAVERPSTPSLPDRPAGAPSTPSTPSVPNVPENATPSIPTPPSVTTPTVPSVPSAPPVAPAGTPAVPTVP